MRHAILIFFVLFWYAHSALCFNQGPPVNKGLYVPTLINTRVENERMTVSEVHLMEPACLVIGMGEAKGSSWGMPDGALPKGSEPRLSDYPMLYIDGTDNYAQWFHHYCWGELDRARFFSETNSTKKDKYLRKWKSAINYVLNTSKDKKWSYRKKVESDLAAAQLASKKYVLAASIATEVIAAASEIEATHVTLIDALIAQEKRDEAVQATQQALKLFGKKKIFARRYKSLTGKNPDMPDIEEIESPSSLSSALESNQQAQKLPIIEAHTESQLAPAKSSSTAPQDKTPEARSGNKQNPYCRFCP